MNSSNILPREGHRLLQIGVALLLFSSFEGFAIPYLAAPRLALSAHTLSALQAVLLLALGLVWPRLNLDIPDRVLVSHLFGVRHFGRLRVGGRMGSGQRDNAARCRSGSRQCCPGEGDQGRSVFVRTDGFDLV